MLETHYGRQTATWPTEPYEFLVWWHCGYPASDAACERGWEALMRAVGVTPEKYSRGLRCDAGRGAEGGRNGSELRAQRLREIAERVLREFGGDLAAALAGPADAARKLLKKFPNIADAGANRILLFAGLAPVAAVPSNCPQVLVRIQLGLERENYIVTYREAQKLIESRGEASAGGTAAGVSAAQAARAGTLQADEAQVRAVSGEWGSAVTSRGWTGGESGRGDLGRAIVLMW